MHINMLVLKSPIPPPPPRTRSGTHIRKWNHQIHNALSYDVAGVNGRKNPLFFQKQQNLFFFLILPFTPLHHRS